MPILLQLRYVFSRFGKVEYVLNLILFNVVYVHLSYIFLLKVRHSTERTKFLNNCASKMNCRKKTLLYSFYNSPQIEVLFSVMVTISW